MRRACRWVISSYFLLYLAALCLLMVGTYGWFGSPRGPLAGVFLVPLGLPWNLWLDRVDVFPGPWLAVIAPLANLLVLATACRLFASTRDAA